MSDSALSGFNETWFANEGGEAWETREGTRWGRRVGQSSRMKLMIDIGGVGGGDFDRILVVFQAEW
jgi:hypothetical protein